MNVGIQLQIVLVRDEIGPPVLHHCLVNVWKMDIVDCMQYIVKLLCIPFRYSLIGYSFVETFYFLHVFNILLGTNHI